MTTFSLKQDATVGAGCTCYGQGLQASICSQARAFCGFGRTREAVTWRSQWSSCRGCWTLGLRPQRLPPDNRINLREVVLEMLSLSTVRISIVIFPQGRFLRPNAFFRF